MRPHVADELLIGSGEIEARREQMKRYVLRRAGEASPTEYPVQYSAKARERKDALAAEREKGSVLSQTGADNIRGYSFTCFRRLAEEPLHTIGTKFDVATMSSEPNAARRRIADVGWRKMSIMLFDHPYISWPSCWAMTCNETAHRRHTAFA